MSHENRRKVTVRLVFLAGLGLWGSACSSTTRYKILSFFMDGVPPPSEKSAGAHGSPAAADAPDSLPSASFSTAPSPPLPSVSGNVIHLPYKERACDFCHDFGGGENGLRLQPPELCKECHAREDSLASTIHWPVNQGRCVTCHDPHQAPNVSLLRFPVPRLCFQCHNGKQLAHGPDMGYCLDCHNPHSSNQPRLLKD